MTTGGLSLTLDGVVAGYGDLRILHDISLSVAAGEAVCIIGRNGMGKTTLISTIAGRCSVSKGSIEAGGTPLHRQSRIALSRMGIALVPQEREVFPNLTLEENLLIADQKGDWTLDGVFELFPRLKERRRHLGAQLSGGEQQMLAVARALMGAPRLLLLDEPSEGLAPVIVDQLFAALETIRATGSITILLVEQHVHRGLRFCPRALGLQNGKLAYDGPSSHLLEHPEALDRIMGLAPATA